MAAESRTHVEGEPEPDRAARPGISTCETCPGKTVFIESDNTDGWIASDLTVDLIR